MPGELSEEARSMLMQFQSYQQQLQNVLAQKETLKLQMLEIEKAVEELSNTKQTTAYKIVGNIMVNKSVVALKKESNELKEDMDIKVKSMDTVEIKLKDKLKELQDKLKTIIK